MKLKKGDTVIVLSGRDKGKTGVIAAVHPSTDKVTVEGINIVKKHNKPSQKHPKGGILEQTLPIWASKVGIVHPTDKKKASRIGFIEKSGIKKRVYRQAANKEIKS